MTEELEPIPTGTMPPDARVSAIKGFEKRATVVDSGDGVKVLQSNTTGDVLAVFQHKDKTDTVVVLNESPPSKKG